MSWEGRCLAQRYTIEARLGAGSMGEVFLARDLKLQSRCVVKVLAANYAQMPNVRARFKTEGLIQGNIHHANIVRATDIVEEGDLLAIVMDYVDGGDVAQHLAARGGRMAWPEVWSLMRPVLDGVSAAHARKVVHRDLKPGNILLSWDGDRLVPKVADFGIAKVLAEAGVGMTRTGAVMGTPAYMSPEQLRGQLDLDERTDIFALGAMLYELLTGVHPWGQGEDVPRRMAQGPVPVPPSSLTHGLPAGLDTVILRAMALERDHRHPDVASLRAELSRLADAPSWGGGFASSPVPPTEMAVEPAGAGARDQGTGQPGRGTPEREGDPRRSEAGLRPRWLEFDGRTVQGMIGGFLLTGLVVGAWAWLSTPPGPDVYEAPTSPAAAGDAAGPSSTGGAGTEFGPVHPPAPAKVTADGEEEEGAAERAAARREAEREREALRAQVKAEQAARAAADRGLHPTGAPSGWCQRDSAANACQQCSSDADCGGTRSSCWAERSGACGSGEPPAARRAPRPAPPAPAGGGGWCKAQSAANACGRCANDADCGGTRSSCWAQRSGACR